MIKKLKPAIKKALKPSLKPRTIVKEPELHLESIPKTEDTPSYQITSLGYIILATIFILAVTLYLIWYPVI